MEEKHLTRVNRIWGFIKIVLKSFAEHKCTVWASSIAYFGIFSFFPMMLFLVFLGSRFLTSEVAQTEIEQLLHQVIPLYSLEIGIVIEKTLSVRGPIGIAAAIGLVWSGSSVFSFLAAALSVIWDVRPRPFLRRRLLAAISVLILGVLFLAAFFLGPVLRLISTSLDIANRHLLTLLVEVVMMVLTSFTLFRVFPNQKVCWKSALSGAVVSSGLIEFVKIVFSVYLGSAFVNYGAVYGSLAWIVSVALWVYLAGLMFFLGAEIAATMEKQGVWN